MQQLDFRVRRSLNGLRQRTEGDRAHINNGMMHSGILHAEDHLQNQSAVRDHFHQILHPGMVQIKWLIAGINPNSRHPVNLVTAPHILEPIRPGEVDASKRNQKAGSMLQAFGRQARIDPTHIFGEQRLETARPSFNDPVLFELRDQGPGVAVFQRAERPTEKIDIGVDDSRGLGGRENLGFAGRRPGRQGTIRGERNGGRAQQGILQEIATIDGLHVSAKCLSVIKVRFSVLFCGRWTR